MQRRNNTIAWDSLGGVQLRRRMLGCCMYVLNISCKASGAFQAVGVQFVQTTAVTISKPQIVLSWNNKSISGNFFFINIIF